MTKTDVPSSPVVEGTIPVNVEINQSPDFGVALIGTNESMNTNN